MKTTNLIWCLVGTMILSSAAWAQGTKDSASKDSATKSKILALEHTWLTSQQTNDIELLKPLLADTVADTSTEGKLMSGKEAAIAEAKSVKWSHAEYSDMQVTVYGDTAIATGVFTGKGTDRAGKPVNVHERYTDTWVKLAGGQWRCVATHGSLLAAS